MGTHCMIFLTIGNLVSPPSFPFAGQVKGRTGPPLRTKDLPALGCSSRAVKPWDLLSRSWHSQDKMFTHGGSINQTRYERLGRPSFSLVLRQVRRSALFRL